LGKRGTKKNKERILQVFKGANKWVSGGRGSKGQNQGGGVERPGKEIHFHKRFVMWREDARQEKEPKAQPKKDSQEDGGGSSEQITTLGPFCHSTKLEKFEKKRRGRSITLGD